MNTLSHPQNTLINNFMDLLAQSQGQALQTKHYFGYMSGLTQQIGSFDYGQHLIVDLYNQTGRTFELSGEDYQAFVKAYRHINIMADQCLFIELETDLQDHILEWRLVQLPFALDYAHALMQTVYHRHQLLDVFDFIQQLDSKALQSFMWSLLSRWEVASLWVSNPASRNHHHAYPGGLLEHSLECMKMVKATLDQTYHFSKREKDLTQVAALLHDIGKTQTLNAKGDLTPEGFNLNHEHYTLSVIHDELKQLKKTYENAAIALEYLLTWKTQDGYPKYIGANLIRAVDRVSTGAQLREIAFSELPDYYYFTSLKAGNQSIVFSRVN